MRIISKSRLRAFWSRRDGREAEGPLKAWYAHISSKAISWNNWADVKASFVSASHVGNCVVFNMGGNKFRLVTRINYSSHKVFVLKVMTHREYDDQSWIDECGCHTSPPSAKVPTTPKKPKPPR